MLTRKTWLRFKLLDSKILLKTMHHLLLLSLKDQCQLQSQLTRNGNSRQEESCHSLIALMLNLTTELLLLVNLQISGLLETHGDLHGEKVDKSDSQELRRMFAVFLMQLVTQQIGRAHV